MNDLEEHLNAALHERAAGITLDRDLLRPAVRRVRSRARLRRGASVAGGVGLAGAVAASGLLTSSAPSPPAPAVTAEQSLDVALVTSRVRAALSNDDVVERVRVSSTVGGVTLPLEVWFDPRTGDRRVVESEARREAGYHVTAGRLVYTQVDHAARTWDRSVFRNLPEDREADAMGAPTPRDVTDLLNEKGSPWTLVGREGGTLHLRQVLGGAPGSSFDVWVDATTYRPARMTMVKERKATVRSTFTWLPRTAAGLASVAVRVPDGYRHIAPRGETPEDRHD